jgi:hypothetical protein
MKVFKIFRVLPIFLIALPLWSQADNPPAQPAPTPSAQGNVQDQIQDQTQDQTQDQANDVMLTPPVVSGQSYPTEPTSLERSNYLRGGMSFTSAYGNNALATTNGKPVNEMSYSIAPTVALDETTSRLHSVLTYAPGFTFYQQTSDLNAANQNASIDVQYRLSPHVTLSAKDGLQKSSSIFNQPDLLSLGAVSPGAQEANFSVIPPVADMLRNSGNVGLSYQFALNGMIGASGTFSNLHYPNPTQVSGLYDSSSQGGSAFYSHRLSRKNYVGATYQYQRLIAYPSTGTSETQTHAILLFYTLYPSAKFSLSFFGGPQYSDTIQPPLAPLHIQLPASVAWAPAAGGSLSWQGRRNTIAMSYSHIISGGGGLIGAVHMDNASMSLGQQLTRTLSGSLAGSYVQNDVIGSFLPGAYDGHTVSGTVSLQKQFHQNVNLQFGYSRLHQDYSDVAVLSQIPNTNREFVSLSYQFSRPIGR